MKRERFIGFYCGLAVVAWAALFFLVLLPFGGHAVHAVTPKQPLTVQEIMQRLGEYDQRIPDCVGLVSGLQGYAYAIPDKVTGKLTVVIVCK